MMAGLTMQVNIVAADHPVWHGTAKSVTIPASEGGMGILPNHEPVLTVIKEGTIVVVDPDGSRRHIRRRPCLRRDGDDTRPCRRCAVL